MLETSDKILDGRKVASELCTKIKNQISELRTLHPQATPPCLAIVQVGQNPASDTYIKHKVKVGSETDIRIVHEQIPSNASEELIKSKVHDLNQNPSVHGIIVQLPLDQDTRSSELWVHELLESISPNKDADGLCTQNLGKLFAAQSTSTQWTSPLPATALGVMRLMQYYKISLKGKRCLVVGKSRLVGNPTAQLLLQAGATVSVVHSQSGDWSDLSRQSDVIVMAAGVKQLLKASQIKENAILLDVGIHRTENGLCGDIDPECYSKSLLYSPVPKGVGPLTVACLMENVFELWKSQISSHT